MSFTTQALDEDFATYLAQLAKLACVALTFTGPLELKYKTEGGCTIVVSIRKETP